MEFNIDFPRGFQFSRGLFFKGFSIFRGIFNFLWRFSNFEGGFNFPWGFPIIFRGVSILKQGLLNENRETIEMETPGTFINTQKRRS